MQTLSVPPRAHLLALSLLLLLSAPSLISQTTVTAAAASPAPGKSFAGRWIDFYRQDWKNLPSPGAAPARRGLTQPLDSPPFPNADWSYGGSPTIGEADGNVYPLMTALNGNKGRTKIYGWISPSLNGSSSAHSNVPVVDDAYSNRFELNQAVLYLERLPDSVQRDHIDVGYHLTLLYGTDYRYTINKGYLSDQLIAHNHQYGVDVPLEYVDVYFPHVAKGMNVRAGRFISVPGIEAQLTPYNYMFSHSLLYSIDPFTDTGVLATVQLNDQWIVQAGVTGSHDVALWTVDAKPSLTACVAYTTTSVKNNFYVCANGINDGLYAYNNLQQYDATWYHKFSKTWHIASEVYAMYQRQVPADGGPVVAESNSNGAFCHAGQTRCFAPEYAFQNYINKELNTHDFIGFRSDFLNDKKGQRTGVATRYSENTLMFSRWVGSTVQLRPEIRFDHAWDRKAYDRGTKQNQFTVASDLIVHF